MVEEFDFNNVALIAQAMANIINADASLPKAVFVGNDTRFLGKWFAIVIGKSNYGQRDTGIYN
jgi:phosphomannomutase